MSGVRSPARRHDDEGRRAELIAAASRVIARHGIAAATTRRIAEEAGVPPGLVHYWFSGKDELLEAVIADTLGEIEAAVGVSRAAATPHDDPAAPLQEQLLAAFGTVASDDRGRQVAMYEMTTWALRKPDLAPVARRQYESYRQLAADGLAAAGIDVAGDPALVQLVAALFDGLTLSWLADPDGTDVEGALALVARLVAGAREDGRARKDSNPQPTG
jgi:AcrR family transcriptional regulator